MQDWLANVKDPDEEKEMGEKRLYIDPEWLEKPKEEEKVDPEEFKKKQSDFFDELNAVEMIETKNEEYHLNNIYDKRCPGYRVNEFGKITQLAINEKHAKWDEGSLELMSKIRQYYFYNINAINEHAAGNDGNSQMFENESFMTNQKISATINEKVKDLSQTIFTAFHMIFNRLKYECNLEYVENQDFAKVIGKFMDSLLEISLAELYEDIMVKLSNDFVYCPSDDDGVKNLVNKILHFNQVDYYRFKSLEDHIGFYKICYEDRTIFPNLLRDEDKRMVMIFLCREMGIISKEFYKFSCYLAEAVQTPNLRYNTLYLISEISDSLSNKMFNYLIDDMQLMIEQLIKDSKYLTEIYEKDIKNRKVC